MTPQKGNIHFPPHYLSVWTVLLCGDNYCYRMHSKLQLKPIQQRCFVTPVFSSPKCYRPHRKLHSCQSRPYFFFFFLLQRLLLYLCHAIYKIAGGCIIPSSPFFHIGPFHSLVPPFYYLWLLYGFRSSREPRLQPSSSFCAPADPRSEAYSATCMLCKSLWITAKLLT